MPGICRSVTTQSKASFSTTLQRLGRTGAPAHVVPRLAQHVGNRFSGLAMIVDDEDASRCLAHSGLFRPQCS